MRGEGWEGGVVKMEGREERKRTLECCDSLVNPTANVIKALRFPGSSCKHLLIAQPLSPARTTHNTEKDYYKKADVLL